MRLCTEGLFLLGCCRQPQRETRADAIESFQIHAAHVLGLEDRLHVVTCDVETMSRLPPNLIQTAYTLRSTPMSNFKLKFSKNLPGNEIILQSAFDKVPIIAQHAVSDRAKETLELVLSLHSSHLLSETALGSSY